MMLPIPLKGGEMCVCVVPSVFICYKDINLFVTNRFDRVELGRFLGRIPSEEDTGDGTDGERKHYAPRLYVNREVGHRVHHQGRAYTEHHAD